jgi:hypothetical protein
MTIIKNKTTIQGMQGEGIKWGGDGGEGVNPSMIYLMHCKNFCKCHNVTPPSKTIKKEQQNKNRKYQVQV